MGEPLDRGNPAHIDGQTRAYLSASLYRFLPKATVLKITLAWSRERDLENARGLRRHVALD
jgi:hypothetical protein